MDAVAATTNDRVAAAAEAIRRQWSGRALAAVILGTGLGELADEVAQSAVISYRDIPGFPRSTALAHHGRVVCGELAGAPVIMLQGRCHLYEGYSSTELSLGVRVLAALGVQTLIVTNAAGGLNPDFSLGDVMIIDDHLCLQGLTRTCRLDPAAHGRVTRQATRLYDRPLAAAAEQVARGADFPVRRGVYLAVTGPSYETRAEYRAFRRLGGDAVGMSTVIEVLTAIDCGLQVLGLSTITNVACPDAPQVVTAQEVVDVAGCALPRVRAIVQGLLTRPA